MINTIEISEVQVEKLLEIFTDLFPMYKDVSFIERNVYYTDPETGAGHGAEFSISWFELCMYHIPERMGDSQLLMNWIVVGLTSKGKLQKHPVDYLYEKYLIKKKNYSVEYEKYMKDVTDKFISICSNKEYYIDLCNATLEDRPDDRITFKPINEATIFECVLNGSFEKPRTKKLIQKRQEDSIKWLKENAISFDEFKKNNKKYTL